MRILPGRRRISFNYFFIAIVCAALTPIFPQQTEAQAPPGSISVATNQQLFDVMCALDAAGFDANAPTLGMYPAHAALRARLLELHGPATEALRRFYQEHRFADENETLTPFISFALVAGPPPNFRFTLSHDELPPDVFSLEGFTQILSNFYAEAHLDQEWNAMQPEMQREVTRLDDPLGQIVLKTSGYLREMLSPTSQRTFSVIVEPLVGDRVNFRNVREHYEVIVGPGPQLPIDDIRHAFLHFLLDPLTLQNQDLIATKSVLLNIAAKAPQLPPAYQTDFLGLFDECLVRAVDLRLRNPNIDQLTKAINDNDRAGFILVRPIYKQLLKFDHADPSMPLYFPELVGGIDVAAELNRFQNFQFAPLGVALSAGGIGGEAEAASPDARLNQSLVQGDRQIAMQDGAGAAATFQGILKEHPDLPRALYGLAVASAMQGQAEKAEELFEKLANPAALEKAGGTAPTPDIVSWSHIFLGRMHDLQGNRDDAVDEYREALAVPGAPESARVAAQQGIAAPYRPQAPKGSSQ